jgi:hypothetical protein
MANVQHNAKLNQLLISIGRSLLQYIGHSSTWTSRADAAMANEFPSLVATQREHIAELSDMLSHRKWTIDFGGYPSIYTDLHFLSLKFLLKRIIINQKAIIAELEEASYSLVDDPEAASLVEEILGSERRLTEELESLSKSSVATR